MNWQLISFFGDSTVLLPSAAALFIVLMLRKTSRLLAWQWSLLFGITGAIVCASKLAFMGWGLGIRELDYTGFSGHSALSAAFRLGSDCRPAAGRCWQRFVPGVAKTYL